MLLAYGRFVVSSRSLVSNKTNMLLFKRVILMAVTITTRCKLHTCRPESQWYFQVTAHYIMDH